MNIRYRAMQFGVTRVTLRDGGPGVHYLQAEQALAPYAERITDRLGKDFEILPLDIFLTMAGHNPTFKERYQK